MTNKNVILLEATANGELKGIAQGSSNAISIQQKNYGKSMVFDLILLSKLFVENEKLLNIS